LKEGTVVLVSLDFVSLGGLFLLAFVGPAFLDGGDVTSWGPNTPAVVVTGLIGAAGIGALLQLTGRALWDFVWPLNPDGGQNWIRKHMGLEGKTFRSDIADLEGVKEYKKIAAGEGWSDGEQVVVATEYLFYSEAPTELREWVRRRYYRFSDGLSAGMAIGLGLSLGASIPRQDFAVHLVVGGLLVIVAFATFLFAYLGRKDAKHMETFWFKTNKEHPPKTPEMGIRLRVGRSKLAKPR
jgi:hypothetical protein